MFHRLASIGLIHINGHVTTFHHFQGEAMDNYEDIDRFGFMSFINDSSEASSAPRILSGPFDS